MMNFKKNGVLLIYSSCWNYLSFSTIDFYMVFEISRCCKGIVRSEVSELIIRLCLVLSCCSAFLC